MTVAEVLAAVVGTIAAGFGLIRWLRVAQREHYIAGSVTRFASRWWASAAVNIGLFAVAVLGVGLGCTAGWVFGVVAVAAVVMYGPIGLGVRGRTSKLNWTRRLKTTAAITAALDLVLAVLCLLLPGRGRVGALLGLVVLQPLVLDGALALAAPFESRAARKFVTKATARLRADRPITVAITGSYGKTSVKLAVRHLASTTRTVVASPASFNNTNGLARTVNEHWVPGTEVFVAEMGMYGPGEIESMCRWVQPTIGVICNIGPVHLERVGSLDGIVAAKSEILADVTTGVLNVDAHGLAALAEATRARGVRVVRCSAADTTADVCVRPVESDPARAAGGPGEGDTAGGARASGASDSSRNPAELWVAGALVGTVEALAGHPGNVACAVGVALELGVPTATVLTRLRDLPTGDHRQAVSVAASGVTVIDNTFSSNPASAMSSVRLLARIADRAPRRVVVTPGMIELGPIQDAENRAFAAAAAGVATDLVIVGRTNARALTAGAGSTAVAAAVQVHRAATRDTAVAWVRSHLAAGDVVLYENDLPDHYP